MFCSDVPRQRPQDGLLKYFFCPIKRVTQKYCVVSWRQVKYCPPQSGGGGGTLWCPGTAIPKEPIFLTSFL